MARALVVSILAEGKQFGAELDKAAGKTRAFSKAAGVAGLAIAGGLAYGLEKSVKAAVSAQQATATMDQAFHNAGLSAARYAGEIDDVSSKGRDLGFMNDDIRSSLTTLITSTGNAKEAFAELGAAENLAREQGIPLTQAAAMLAKANTGSTRALKALGLQQAAVKKATIEATAAQTVQVDQIKAAFGSTSKLTAAQVAQEDHEIKLVQLKHAHAIAQAAVNDKSATGAKIVQLLNDKMGGMAEKFSGTLEGRMAVFHAQWENIEESLGKGLLPILSKVVSAFSSLASWMGKHTTATKILVAAIGALSVVLMTAGAAAKLSALYTSLFVAAEGEATTASAILAGAIDAIGIVAVAAAFAFAAYEIYTHWSEVSGFFVSLWDDIKHVFDDVLGWLEDHWKIFLGLPGLVWQYWGPISSFFEGIWQDVESAFTDAFDWIKNKLTDGISALGNIADEIGTAIWDGLKNGAEAVYNWIVGKFDWILNKLDDIKNAVEGATTGGLPAGSKLKSTGKYNIPVLVPSKHHAAGLMNSAIGHWAMVGEKGPELMYVPQGSSIFPHGASPHGISSGRSGGGDLYATVPVYIDGRLVEESTHRQALRNSYRGNAWAAA